MNHKVYSVRDSKGEVFLQPFLQKTHGEAERNFKTAAMDDKSSINKYPEDFDLYFLGEFDDVEGKIIPLDSPQHLIKAANIPARD